VACADVNEPISANLTGIEYGFYHVADKRIAYINPLT